MFANEIVQNNITYACLHLETKLKVVKNHKSKIVQLQVLINKIQAYFSCLHDLNHNSCHSITMIN